MRLEDFEFAEPKQVAPGIPADAAQQLNPIDKMAQIVIPKMVDKINYLTARIDQLTKIAEYLLQRDSAVDDIWDGQKNVNDKLVVAVDKLEKDDRLDGRLESLCHIVGGLEQRIEALEKKEPTIQEVRKAIDDKPKTRIRKKASAKVDYASIADYDPDKDIWKPKKIAGKEMSISLINCVLAMTKEQATDIYDQVALDFVYSLSDGQKEFIESIS